MPGSLRIHDVAIAATNDGAWLGTSENYEVELIDWTGTTIRRIRWDGLDLAVTPQDVEWFAFDPDGTWIRTLVLPARTRLLDIGPDWALVRMRDWPGMERSPLSTAEE